MGGTGDRGGIFSSATAPEPSGPDPQGCSEQDGETTPSRGPSRNRRLPRRLTASDKDLASLCPSGSPPLDDDHAPTTGERIFSQGAANSIPQVSMPPLPCRGDAPFDPMGLTDAHRRANGRIGSSFSAVSWTSTDGNSTVPQSKAYLQCERPCPSVPRYRATATADARSSQLGHAKPCALGPSALRPPLPGIRSTMYAPRSRDGCSIWSRGAPQRSHPVRASAGAARRARRYPRPAVSRSRTRAPRSGPAATGRRAPS